MKKLSQTASVTGRVMVASLFILGGLNKIMNYDVTLSTMTDAGLSPAAILLPGVIALEIIGGVIVATGRRWTAAAACVLAGFTLVVNGYFHRFWAAEPVLAPLELSLFFKNISIAGALLYIAATASMSR